MPASTALQRLRERRKAIREAEVSFLSGTDYLADEIHEEAETTPEEPQGDPLDFYEARVAEMAEIIRASRRLRGRRPDDRLHRERMAGKKPRLPKILEEARRRDKEARKRMAEEGLVYLHRKAQRVPVPTLDLERLQEIHRWHCPRTEYDEFCELAERMSVELGEPYTVERLVLGYGHDLDRDNHHLRILTVQEARERALARRPLHEWSYTDDGSYSVPEGLLEALQANHSPEEIDTLVSVATLWKAKLNDIRERARKY